MYPGEDVGEFITDTMDDIRVLETDYVIPVETLTMILHKLMATSTLCFNYLIIDLARRAGDLVEKY